MSVTDVVRCLSIDGILSCGRGLGSGRRPCHVPYFPSCKFTLCSIHTHLYYILHNGPLFLSNQHSGYCTDKTSGKEKLVKIICCSVENKFVPLIHLALCFTELQSAEIVRVPILHDRSKKFHGNLYLLVRVSQVSCLILETPNISGQDSSQSRN